MEDEKENIQNEVIVEKTPEEIEKEKKKQAKEEAKRKLLFDKKVQQGIDTLEKVEKKKISELVVNTATPNVVFIYFGVGNEADCSDLEAFFEKLGYQEKRMDIYPGFPHGVLEFSSTESAREFMGKLEYFEYNQLTGAAKTFDFTQKKRTAFFFYSGLKKSEMNNTTENGLPDATTVMDIQGLFLIEDFITIEEEREIFEAVEKREWHPLATRRVQHDGYEFIYGQNNVNPNNKLGPLPSWIVPCQKRLETETDKVNGANVGLDQLTINDYNPGDGIPPHVDAIGPFCEAFAAISMCSGTVMNFRHPNGTQKNVYLAPRSAIIFTGEGRLEWQHSIACRKMDRIEGKLVRLGSIGLQKAKAVAYFQKGKGLAAWRAARNE